jgi:hypothetical protein
VKICAPVFFGQTRAEQTKPANRESSGVPGGSGLQIIGRGMDGLRRIRMLGLFDFSSLKSQVSSLKSQVSSLKSQVSSLKFQISNFKFQISNFRISEFPNFRI